MLAPLGFFLVPAARRVVWPAALVVVPPAAIELTRIVIPGRECSPEDWFANALGGLAGVAAAVPRSRRRRGTDPRWAARPAGEYVDHAA